MTGHARSVRILKAVSQEIQSRGYSFNTLTSVTLKPDSFTNKVAYGRDFLRAVSTSYKFVSREGYFYDLDSGNLEFPEGITLDELVRELPFEELPQVFRKYITVRASRVFQMRYLTSADIDSHLQLEESAAYADIVDYELTDGNYNILNDDQFISQQTQRS